MEFSEALALLMLAELPHVGEHGIVRFQQLTQWKGLALAEALALPPPVLGREYGLPPPAVARLCGEKDQHTTHCQQILSRLAAVGGCVSQPGDPAYPRRWLEATDRAPPLVYLYGNQANLLPPTLAILSSRAVTEHTVSATIQVARVAAREGFTLVAGGMKTTHRIAAVTMRATGTRRTIVLDRGLLAAFGGHLEHDPFGFGPERARFDRQTTLALSCFRPTDHAAPRNGRRRDELIAALADIVVAVSARPGGEIERICLRAVDRGHCVLSWQGTNAALVAAGALSIDETDLNAGLCRFLTRRVEFPPG